MSHNSVTLESIIGYTLLICVIVALSLEILGLILYISTSKNISITLDQRLCIQEKDFFSYAVRTINSTMRRPNFLNLMSLGLVVLMFTPYLRAVLSVAYFILARNYKYTLITSFVLVVITASLMVH